MKEERLNEKKILKQEQKVEKMKVKVSVQENQTEKPQSEIPEQARRENPERQAPPQQPNQQRAQQPQAQQAPPQQQATAQQQPNQQQQNMQDKVSIEIIEKLTKQIEEQKGFAVRLQADFENFKKRNKSIAQEMYQEGLCDAIKEILPVMDSFDRALQGCSENEKQGIELIQKQFLDALTKLNVQEIEAEGCDFDPNFHNAVMQIEVRTKSQGGKVVKVLQKGYQMGDKILRYAMVQVSVAR